MKYLTSSELGDWDQCRRKWWLRHVEGWQPAEESKGAAYIGTQVHDALEGYYKGLRAGQALADLEDRYAAAVDAQELPEAQALDYARAMVSGYFEWLEETGADQDWEPLEAEGVMHAPLLPGVVLLAKLDLRFRRRSDGFLALVDHKSTGESLEVLETGAFFRPQFAHYLAAASLALDEPVDGLVVNGIKRTKRTARAKGPFYTRFTIRHNPTAQFTYLEHTRAKASGMLTAEQRLADGHSHHSVVPPSPNPACSRSCPFTRVCPLFDDGGDAQAALEMGYVQADPLARYDGLI